MGGSHLEWMRAIAVTRVTAELVPREAWSLPPQPAVMLRGAVGAAVLDLVCRRQDRACERCDARGVCIVPCWYDPGRGEVPGERPFVLRVHAAGGSPVNERRPLRAEWVFFGELPRSSLFVEALCRAADLGLGPDRVSHEVRRLVVEGAGAPSHVVEHGRGVGLWPDPAPLSVFVRLPELDGGRPAEARVWTRSPFRFDRRTLRPEPADLLRAALRRVRALTRTGPVLHRWPDPREVEAEWEALERIAASRWSARQGEDVRLDGWMGMARFGAGIEAFSDLLEALPILGLGRSTSAGFGWVEVSWR